VNFWRRIFSRPERRAEQKWQKNGVNGMQEIDNNFLRNLLFGKVF
jgi:hypothetical protein